MAPSWLNEHEELRRLEYARNVPMTPESNVHAGERTGSSKMSPPHPEEFMNSTLLRENASSRPPTPGSLVQSREDPAGHLAERAALSQREAFPEATSSLQLPSDRRQMPSPKEKPPSTKQENASRKHPRLRTATARAPKAAAHPSMPNSRLFVSVESLDTPEDTLIAARAEKPTVPELTLWGSRKGGRGVTSHSPLQISPFTASPITSQALPPGLGAAEPAMVDARARHQEEEGSSLVPVQVKNTTEEEQEEEQDPAKGASFEEGQGTTTSTIVTTTVISTEHSPVLCGMNFYDPEGYIDSTDFPPLPRNNFLECTYNVTVYTGYGVELQVKSVNLSEGEVLSIRGVDDDNLVILANQTLLVEGQVIRSPTNTISVYFRTFPEDVVGTFQLHYQVFMLSCSFPRRPDFGEVTVLGLHPGGTARFHCHLGYELEGPEVLTCINASKPHWSPPEAACAAPCGGTVQNATLGRILAPTHLQNHSESLLCVWTLWAPEGQKLHLHFERLLLGDKQRMAVYSGETNRSLVLYDSQQSSSLPFEGVISEGTTLRLEFLSDDPSTGPVFNIRFEAFEKGHCYEPYIQNGNFTTSDPTYNLGAVVEFTCDPGHSLEQGPAIIECINIRDPYWNDTEPLCRAMCGGQLSTAAGVILSPNWPGPYAEGEDCVWRVHVGEEKRIFLDIQFLNLSDSDILTVYDGDDLTTHILGQFLGSSGPQKLYSSSPDLTIQFHSDPAGLFFGKGHGFIMNYIEVSRNDSCSDLPEIQNGWKTTSHTELVREAKITYQCDPGYDIVGSDTLTCQWDLSWSSDPPFCEKIMYCTDPGEVGHSTRLISDPVLLVGTTIQYTCNPGFVLEGSSLLTCYSRETGTPIWTSRLPHCVSEESLACDNPGLPENGYQILYKRLYLPGESLTFVCYEGFELLGEVTIKCILGQPSHWSGPLPVCRVNQDSFEHALEVAEAAAQTSLEGGNMALAIFIPVLLVSLLLGGAYVYLTRCRYSSSLRLPLMYSHPYSQITVETEFDNPIYETGETREYEVSI
ncbi:seizure 6-like protein [Heteronotia binoei]|uniref:seizure 6-like protein n=1 Tax=Heteronotia binoei TaxID=13085 RepID=UPI00293042EE|nr:seizure 6-like protein [Heteronotia binoei]